METEIRSSHRRRCPSRLLDVVCLVAQEAEPSPHGLFSFGTVRAMPGISQQLTGQDRAENEEGM